MPSLEGATAVIQALASLLAAVFNFILARDAYVGKERAWKIAVPALSGIAFLIAAAAKLGLFS